MGEGIGTWEDVADPEDEFHISRDKVLLEGDDGGGGGRGGNPFPFLAVFVLVLVC